MDLQDLRGDMEYAKKMENKKKKKNKDVKPVNMNDQPGSLWEEKQKLKKKKDKLFKELLELNSEIYNFSFKNGVTSKKHFELKSIVVDREIKKLSTAFDVMLNMLLAHLVTRE